MVEVFRVSLSFDSFLALFFLVDKDFREKIRLVGGMVVGRVCLVVSLRRFLFFRSFSVNRFL